MSGPLALIGGGEHLEGCEPIDRALLDAVGADPLVAVIPAAHHRKKRPERVALAIRYWAGLGVKPEVLHVDDPGAEDHTFGVLREADIIVMTGGHPTRFKRLLQRRPVMQAIIDRWREGSALSMASAAAMAACQWQTRMRGVYPLGFVPGLGLVRDCAAIPHYDKGSIRFLSDVALRLTPEHCLVGIDERTGLILQQGRKPLVRGKGAVTLVHRQEEAAISEEFLPLLVSTPLS